MDELNNNKLPNKQSSSVRALVYRFHQFYSHLAWYQLVFLIILLGIFDTITIDAPKAIIEYVRVKVLDNISSACIDECKNHECHSQCMIRRKKEFNEAVGL